MKRATTDTETKFLGWKGRKKIAILERDKLNDSFLFVDSIKL